MFLYSICFFYKNIDLTPRVSRVKLVFIKSILSSGLWTVFVQIIYIAKINVPVIIVSSTIGMAAVAEFSIAQKMIGVGGLVISMALQPLWTVYGEAYFKGDKKWVQKTLSKTIKIVLLLTSIGGAIFITFGQMVVEIWLGTSVMPSLLLIIGFSLWMMASSLNVCFAMVLNGTGHFKNQSIFSASLVGTSLIVAYFLSPIYGMESVIFTMFLIAEVFRVPLFFFETKKVISKI
jgi:O-antigen/teichoic acid export membrane protein